MSEFEQVLDDGKKSVRRIFSRIVLFLVLAGILVGAGYLWVSNWTYSDGYRAGHLIKISRKGVFWKTYEGQLNLGGFQSGEDGLSGNIWSFSVPKRAVYEELLKYEGRRVRLSYRQVWNNMPWQGKTDYMVYEIKLLE